MQLTALALCLTPSRPIRIAVWTGVTRDTGPTCDTACVSQQAGGAFLACEHGGDRPLFDHLAGAEQGRPRHRNNAMSEPHNVRSGRLLRLNVLFEIVQNSLPACALLFDRMC